MPDSAIYRKNANDLLQLALKTSDPAERGRLISLAARWHMRAAEAEGSVLPTPEDFSLESLDSPDASVPDPAPPEQEADEP